MSYSSGRHPVAIARVVRGVPWTRTKFQYVDVAPERVLDGVHVQPRPETDALRAELRLLLLRAIDDLPPPFQEIVKLRDVEDCSNLEAARRPHISPQNAAVRLHGAHRLLRDRLMPLR